MSSAPATSSAAAVEVAFTPALPAGQPKKPGTGFLQRGGLVVHTGWSLPLPPEEQLLRQYPAWEDSQCWGVSTPDGRRATRFKYLTRERAEKVAAAVAAAVPGGAWPADADVAGDLLGLALEASSGPRMLPLERGGKPDWGYGCVNTYWTMPDTRAAYERMIAAHGGAAPKSCRTCAGVKKRWAKEGWVVRTGHWPRWNPGEAHARGRECRAHCPCMACIGPVVIGTLGTVFDDAGRPVPGSIASHTGAVLPDAAHRDVPYGERGTAWFRLMLEEGGCVVMDNRPCEGLWPRGVRHDDAFFCETGDTGYALPEPPATPA
ncbi:hypothetical protein [Streptomyces sp. H27-C3]|uniref:hypothetical protein n=1 Tax=Streptomyces sp. H27-C3 TaxID=3046305 RepID=UPI0024B99F06|nr:hypothetical protein [Streptomyces sp. H27-C3]MDJ0466093.1 hypothetical protein [Streptomyces sp. H27-C3]